MTFDSISEADRYITSFCTNRHIDENRCFKIRLVIEELVTNMFKYTKTKIFTLFIKNTEPIKIVLEYPSDKFDFTIKKPEPKDLSKIKEGGLGLFLVESMTNTFTYRHQDGKSIYTLTI